MKTEDLLLLGIAGVAIYFLFFKKNGLGDLGSGGGGGEPPIVPAPIVDPSPSRAIHIAAGSRQAWSGASFGQPGQPSVVFAGRTLLAAKRPGASLQTKMAASAIYAGAPPRVVAKIKAGKWY